VGLAYEHAGPHVASAVARYKLVDSAITVTYSLKAGAGALEIHLRVNWLHRGSADTGTPCLRMKFPFALREACGQYEIPFGSIERPPAASQEVPALRWADVNGEDASGKSIGCALLNDCKYGHSLDGSTLRLTLIRSSYEPDPLPELGEHEIRLALAPHDGAPVAAELHRLAAAFNQPVQAVSTGAHAGALPPSAAGIVSCEPAGVVLCSVKKAESGDALVFRLLETSGAPAEAKVVLDEAVLGRVVDAVETDLLERPKENFTAKIDGNGFLVALPASGLASVMVRFA
jgi:alpha-mannosidase